MAHWLPGGPKLVPYLPQQVDRVYVLSRVTLGADIKITSIILDAMKKRFPQAAIVFVASRKSAELFAADRAIVPLEADYPRSGPVSERLAFAEGLSRLMTAEIGTAPNRIVVDPDSRITQLGLVPVCEPEHFFHFPSRVDSSAANLTDLTKNWVESVFGVNGQAYIAPHPIQLDDSAPRAAVSLGVGGNDAKRISAEFEAALIRDLAAQFQTIWLDRGSGGEEYLRVTAAAEASGAGERIRFWEGSFAGFTSIISQSHFYAGYDSAGQHAADACGIPLTSHFAGAPSPRFEERWRPVRNFRPTMNI